MSASAGFRSACLIGWVLLSACGVKTRLGSSCPGGVCQKTLHISCKDVQQLRPTDCAGDDAGVAGCRDARAPGDDLHACEVCRQRIIDLDVGETAMTACACAHCAVPLAGCFASGDPQRDEDCRKLVVCGWAHLCAGSTCYCGDANAQDCYDNATGPCAAPILAVTGCHDTACVEAQRTSADTALHLANEVAKCLTGDPLFPDPSVTPLCPLSMFEAKNGNAVNSAFAIVR